MSCRNEAHFHRAHSQPLDAFGMDTQIERREEGWICISVALLPHYGNVGATLGNESNNIQDVWLNSSLESLSLLEEMAEDCELEI